MQGDAATYCFQDAMERAITHAGRIIVSWIPKVYNGKDKTFFFFTFEYLPTTTTTSNNLLTVPTAQYQAGNFSAALAATGNKSLGTDPLGRPKIGRAHV